MGKRKNMALEYETDNTLPVEDGEVLKAYILGLTEASSFEFIVEPRSVGQLLTGEVTLVEAGFPTRRYQMPSSDLKIISENPLRACVGHLILEKRI